MKGRTERTSVHRPAFETLEPRLLLNGMIEGQVWDDLNGDGLRDPGELGLNGWTVELVDQSTEAIVASTVTGPVDLDGNGAIDPQTESGLYEFTGVAVGNYDVRQVLQAGWVQSQPALPSGEFVFRQAFHNGAEVENFADPSVVAVSPDGTHVYAASEGGDSLLVFRRSQVTGELALWQEVVGSEEGMFKDAMDLAVSPDGRHVFITSEHNDSLSVFERSADDGRLSLIQLLQDGVDGLTGFNGAWAVAVSPDGGHVYASGQYDNTLTVLNRDATTGLLTVQQQLVEGQGGVTGLHVVQSMAFSADGASLYVGSNYSGPLAYFSRDLVTGELTHVQTIINGVDGVEYTQNARDVVVSRDGTSVYVAAKQSSALIRFDRNVVTGVLTFGEAYRNGDGYSGLGGAFAVDMSDDDQFVFVVPGGGVGGLTTFRRDPASGALTYLGHTPTEGLGNMRDVAVSPDGRTVYLVCTYGDEGLAVLEHLHDDHYVAAMTAETDFVGMDFGNFLPVDVSGQLFDDANNDGVRDVDEVGLNGRAMHLVDTVTGSVSEITFTTDVDLNGDGIIDPVAEAGWYQFQDVWPGAYDVQLIVPEGYLQTTPAAGHTMSLVSGDADQTGLDFGMFLATPAVIQGQLFDDLDADGVHDAGESGIDGLAVELLDRTTQLVLASTTSASQDLNGDGVIDPATEAGLYEFQIGPGQYVVRQILPSGRHYSSPVDAGGLTFVQRVEDNTDGVDGIDGPVSFIISPDGQFLYTAAATDDAIAVFRRNKSTGELSFVEAIFSDGLFGLDDPMIAMSPDGGHLYCISREHATIEVFGRDEVSGRLTFLQTLRNGVDGIDGISSPEDVVVSPDGLNVYVISEGDGVLSVYSRDPLTGLLAPQQILRDADGVPGVARGRELAISGDGRNVYVTTWTENALGVFSRDPVTGELTSRQTLEGITGLSSTRDVVVSADGLNVYVASNHFASFRRDPATGELSFLGADALGGGDGATIVLSADGRFVFVTDVWQHPLRVLERDPFTGELELIDTNIEDPGGGNTHFRSAYALALSPDGRFLYVSTDPGTGAISALAVSQEEGTHDVMVQAGETAAGLSFGSYQNINSVGGMAFHDENANGQHDAGEAFLDTALTLRNTDTNELFTTSTDPLTGVYAFSDVRPGSYELQTTLDELAYIPTEPTDGMHAIILSSGGSDVLGLDFGFLGAGVARGTVFADRDMDGIYGSSDFGLAGRSVEAENAATGEVFSTTTLADGTYELGPLPIGAYEVRQVLPAGWSQTSPAGDASYAMIVEPAGVAPGLNFGSVAAGVVEGRVIEDVNGDGLIAADEPGLNARTVELIDEVTGAVVATATTGDLDRDGDGLIDPATERGWYVFPDIVVGSYQVRQVLPDGWHEVAPTEHVLTALGETERLYFEVMGPDGQDIYGVAGHTSTYHQVGRFYHYRRDVGSGEVQATQTFYPSIDDDYRWDQTGWGTVAMSPDNTTIYKGDRFYANDTGSYSYVIEIFARDAETGHLTWTDTQFIRDLIGSAQAPDDLLVSPDGLQLIARTENGILTFDIDPLTRRLSNGVATRLAVGMTYNFESFTSMEISADGLNIYLLGWAHEPSHTSYDRSIAVTLQRDPVTGSVTIAQIFDNRQGPYFDHRSRILFDADEQFAYLRNYDGVSVWRRDPATGTLALEQTLSILAETGLENLVSLVMHPDGSHLYALDYWQDTLVVFNRDSDTGSVALESVVTLEDLFGEPVSIREMQSSLEISEDGRMLYVALSYDSLIIGIDPVNASRAVVVAGNDVVTQYFTAAGLVNSIAGQAIDDATNNGVRDVTDVGLEGWVVELQDVSTGYVIASALTQSIDVNGNGVIDPVTEAGLYEFTDLLPGQYQISMIIREGYTQTFPAGSVYALNLVSAGPDQTGLDMGFFLSNPAEVHGQLFHDANANGAQDAGEVGLDGRTVELVDAGAQAVVATAVTASDDLNGDGIINPATEVGLYSFTNVPPGDYEVRQVIPAGWRQTGPFASAAEITHVETHDTADGWYNAVVISPDGVHGYVLSHWSVEHHLKTYARDLVTGELTTLLQDILLPRDGHDYADVVWMAASPDGDYLYVATSSESDMLVFQRDVGSGLLTQIQALPYGGGQLAVGADSRFVYVASQEADALLVLERDAVTGLLSVAQSHTWADLAIAGGTYLETSPDGQSLYFSASHSTGWNGVGELMVFDCDQATGALTLLESFSTSAETPGLTGIVGTAVSPDGTSLYLIAEGSNPNSPTVVLNVFARDVSTGKLTPVVAYTSGYDGFSLGGPASITVSSDGRQVFVARSRHYYTSDGVGVLTIFDRDTTTGELSLAGEYSDSTGDIVYMSDSRYGLTMSPDGRFLYVDTEEHIVLVLERTPSNSIAMGLGADDIVVSQDFGAAHVISVVAGQVVHDDDADGSRDPGEMGTPGYAVRLFDVDAGYAVAQAVSAPVDLNGDGLIDPDTEWGVYQFANVLPGDYEIRLAVPDGATQTYPAGDHALTLSSGDAPVTGLDFGAVVADPASISGQKFEDRDANGQQDTGEEGLDGWTIELIDAETGQVIASRVTASVDLDGDGSIDPETEAGLYTFDYLLPGDYEIHEVAREGWTQTAPSQRTAQLTPIQQVPEGTGGLNGAGSSALSPDGRQLYVTDNFGDALAIFQRNPYTGQLTLDQELRSAGPDAFNLAANVIVSPDGLFVYLTERDAFYVFQRDPATGDLTFLQTLRDGENDASLSYPRAQAISPDGSFIYVADEQFRGAVTVFRRDPASGLLSVEQVVEHDTDGLDDFNAPYVIRISPDGAHAFVSARLVSGDEALYVFTRDAVTGHLAHPQTIYASTDAPQMGKPADLACSLDGRHVYTVSPAEDAVTIFARDEITGELSLVESVYADAGYAVTVSPDGQFVYEAGNTNSILLYHRDAATGELTLADQADTLAGILGLTLSQEGRFLYALAWADTSVIDVFEHVHTVRPIEHTLTAGDVVSDADFGNARVSALSGQVFADVNNDGVHDAGENGANGWAVELIDLYGIVVAAAVTVSEDLDGDGVIDPATEAGWFTFNEILSGDYELRVVLPIAWTQSAPEGNYPLSLNGQTVTDLDFGVFMPAGISGQVFADRHLDGVHDAGDLGQDGWTVELVDAATGLVVGATTTASVDLDGNGVIAADTESGLYSFGDLISGDYEVRHVLLAGWSQVAPIGSHLVSLTIGEDVTGVDFADIGYGDIEGQAFEDINGNASQDAGEPGMNGWTIEIVDAATGDVIATAATADDDRNGNGAIDPVAEAGWYSFTDLPVADYLVRQSSDPDYVQTLPGPVSTYGEHDVTATGNATVSDVDFGVFALAAVEGQVFADVNYDGLRDADEDGSNDWTVELVDVGSGAVVDTAVTADVDVDGDGVIDPHTESGLYAFADVLPGSHEIRLILPELWSQTYPAGLAHSYLPLSGQTQGGLDFGVASLPSIAGQVFYDSDGDGLHDGDENGLNIWTVELVDPATGGVLATAITADRDIDGNGTIDPIEEQGTYRFTDLLPGTYLVRQVAQNGWIQTAPVTTTYTYTVDIAQHETEGDFGNYQPSSVSGQKWHDVDADGVRDGGDVGLSGWTIELVDAATGLVVATTVTADVDLNTDGAIDPMTEAGLYSFIDLPAGDYELREVQQAGWVQSWGGLLDVSLGVRNGPATLYYLETFEYYPYWLEDSHTGLNRQPGLWKVNDDVYANGALDRWNMPQYTPGSDPNVYWFIFEDTRTGEGYWQASGDKDFNDMDVKVVEDPTAGTVEVTGYRKVSAYTFRLIGPDGTVYSESGGQIGPVTFDTFPIYGAHAWTFGLANDQSVGDLDFSNFQGGGEVTGQHVNDLNANGVRDDGEVGLDGWTVEGVNPVSGRVVGSAVTGSMDVDGDGVIDPATEMGLYSLASMPAGTFDIRLVVPEGWAQTAPFGDTHTVTFAAGEAQSGFDFAAAELGMVSGQLFNDLDSSGVQEVGEFGINGWTVELIDTDTGLVIAATTSGGVDGNGDGTIDPLTEAGRYTFSGVSAGNYETRPISPSGWTQTSPMADPFSRLFAADASGGVMTIHEIDPTDGSTLNSFAGPANPVNVGYQGLAAGPDSLFYVDANNFLTPTLWELDPDTGAVIDSDPLTFGAIYVIKGLAYLDGLLYIQYMPDQVAVWDPASDSFVQTLTISAAVTGSLTGAGDLGVLFDSNAAGEIIAIDPTDGSVLNTFATGLGALDGGLAYVGGELLAISSGIGSLVHRIDPSTGAVLGSFALDITGSIVGLGGDYESPAAPAWRQIALAADEHAAGADYGYHSSNVRGDMDGDGDVDADDIDLLFGDFGDAGRAGPQSDLDGDGDADVNDMDILVRDILMTEYGDANLDGLVDATDLAILGVNYASSGVGWSGSDFNGSGLVNLTDLAILATYFGFDASATTLSMGPPPASQPPPPAAPVQLATSASLMLAPQPDLTDTLSTSAPVASLAADPADEPMGVYESTTQPNRRRRKRAGKRPHQSQPRPPVAARGLQLSKGRDNGRKKTAPLPAQGAIATTAPTPRSTRRRRGDDHLEDEFSILQIDALMKVNV